MAAYDAWGAIRVVARAVQKLDHFTAVEGVAVIKAEKYVEATQLLKELLPTCACTWHDPRGCLLHDPCKGLVLETPLDHTEVLINGMCQRCGAVVKEQPIEEDGTP